MKCFVTGGAGFIGSHLVDKLMEKCSVTVYDSLSLGKESHIRHHFDNKNFKFIKADLLDFDTLNKTIQGHDVVFHLAANSDISNNKVTDIDLKVGTIATYNVLEAMRLNRIKKIVFSSTSSIYGEARIKPTPEDYGPLFPISYYGASKLACEALISTFCHNFQMQSWIFRLANIAGDRGTHGVIIDFIKKLEKNNKELEILGDGEQAKPYLYVKDCVDGMLYGFSNSNEEVNYFNLSSEGSTKVKTIASILVEEIELKNVKFKFTGTARGWSGDVPRVEMDTRKLAKLGWKSKMSSDESLRKAIKELLKHYKPQFSKA
jgi:UDP-glucose 4-epimerase